MLSAKNSRKHGMKNEKWDTKEKSLQYRAILKLHARDKKLQAINGEILKRKVSRTLKELKTDINEYRCIVKDTIFGDKRIIRAHLQGQKDFQKFLQDAIPVDAYKVVFQDYNLKRKQLDKLMHLKEKKKKDICNLKSEYSVLTEKLEKVEDVQPIEVVQQSRQQELITRYQVALAKHHAAQSIANTYRTLLDILQRDSKYFDGVLNALRGDQRDQCRVIYKTTIMGQLAAENLDDIRQKYKKMTRDVWVNMKERERSLDITRKKVEDVWEYAKSLVRIESDTNLNKKKRTRKRDIDKELQKQIQRLEEIFNKMQESLLIRSYEELFVRLEDQMMQRERLSHLYKKRLKEKRQMLTKKNHAELILHTLEHSVLSTTTRYKTEKKEMKAKIEEEKKREADNLRMVESRGELLMNVRAALQSLSSMLLCVKVPKGSGKGKEARRAARETAEKGECKENQKDAEIDPCKDPIENEGIGVLNQVSRKAIALFGYTNFSLDKAKAAKAKNMYETYLADYRSQLKFGQEEPEQGMYFEHEIVDPNVLTRIEIKKNSKRIVDANMKQD